MTTEFTPDTVLWRIGLPQAFLDACDAYAIEGAEPARVLALALRETGLVVEGLTEPDLDIVLSNLTPICRAGALASDRERGPTPLGDIIEEEEPDHD